MNELLEISNLSFFYGDKRVLDNVDFILYKGDITCVRGKNGAGKTTLLKVLSTILTPREYNVKYLGEKTTLEEIKENIIFIPNSPYLYESLTGWQNIELIRNLYQKDKKIFYDNVNKYIIEYDMRRYLDDFVESYSLGMKYKVYFVAVLSVDHDIILMDEPLNAMDSESQKKAIHSLKNMVFERDKTILFSSHISGLISDLATREYAIHNGKIINNYNCWKN